MTDKLTVPIDRHLLDEAIARHVEELQEENKRLREAIQVVRETHGKYAPGCVVCEAIKRISE